jgi:hypothetical protein
MFNYYEQIKGKLKGLSPRARGERAPPRKGAGVGATAARQGTGRGRAPRQVVGEGSRAGEKKGMGREREGEGSSPWGPNPAITVSKT